MNTYQFHNQVVRSSIPLNLRETTEEAKAIEIRRGWVSCHTASHFKQFPDISGHEDKIILNAQNIGRFNIKRGEEITVDTCQGVEPYVLSEILCKQALGITLLQQKRLILHASANRVGDFAFAFVGENYSGKSTLSTSLNMAGASSLADDICPIFFRNKSPYLYQNYSSVRLRRDSLDNLKLRSKKTFGEQYIYPINISDRANIILRAIFFLEWGSDFSISEVPVEHSCLYLLKNLWGSELSHQLLGPDSIKSVANLAENVSCFHLVRPKKFELLKETSEKIFKFASQFDSAPNTTL